MKKLLALLLALFTFCALLTPALAANAPSDTLRLLLPYHIGWVEDAAAMYEEQTGVQVTIDTTLTGETEIYGPGKSQKALNILRENLAAAVESGKYDLVYSWAVPAELMTRPNLLINLDELAAADPECSGRRRACGR